MTPAEAVTIVAVAITGGCLLYPVFRGLGRRLEGRPPREGAVPPEFVARLERMERGIEAMAIEVERISEGQRFVTRLLADRERDPARLPGDTR